MRKHKLLLVTFTVLVLIGLFYVTPQLLQGRLINRPPKLLPAYNENLQLLKSNFFKDDATALQIASGKLIYKMEELALLTGLTDINKDVYAYKLLSAFKMLGYMTDKAYYINGNKPHILVLNQFQNSYGFEESSFVSKAVLLKMDELLFAREKMDAKYAREFPLFTKIGYLHKNDISKAHVAALYQLAMDVLPAKYRMVNEKQYLACVGQCDYHIGGYSGDMDNPGDYIFYEPHNYEVDGQQLSLLQSDVIHFKSTLHEFAHHLDDSIKTKNEELLMGVIDTKEFYEISNIAIQKSEYTEIICYKPKPGMTAYDYISDYAASPSVTAAVCPEGTGMYAEDFAESFSYYVTAGKNFREATKNSGVLKQKYEWLKSNIFEGKEFDTNLPAGNMSGCDDMPWYSHQKPGYIDCNEDYVWDGTIPVL